MPGDAGAEPGDPGAEPGDPGAGTGALVRYERAGSVARLTLDGQANRNALSRPLMAALEGGLDRAESDGSRVVVLTHSGPAFCAGADLKERTAGTAASPAAIFRRLLDCPLPVVAVVAGAVRAGGLGLLACADMTFATPGSTFAAPEVQRGLVPALIAALCARRVSPSGLQRYFLTGEVFDASAAARIGLVTEVVDADRLTGEVASVTGALALGSPTALATTKRLLRERGDSSLSAQLAAMERLSEEVFGSADAREGMRAFLERRPPAWQQPDPG